MNEKDYIKMALTLAEIGKGQVSPNPLVGAVVVKNNKIIGHGCHKKFGEKHAEINALESCTENPAGGEIYVNLEPCSHQGKTPPCAEAIISSGIKKVFIGTADPNPLVQGKGIMKLKAAGIEVRTGILENECHELNRFFFKYISTGLPYISLKTAQTIDGKIADHYGNSKWISSEESRRLVHQWRGEYDAVMVGKGTVIADDPGLNVRLVNGRNPHKIIIDRNLSLDTEFRLFKDTSSKIFIIANEDADLVKIEKLRSAGIDVISAIKNEKGYPVLKDALQKLAKENISSILVEGGSAVFSGMIKENLADEIITFISPKILGPGKGVFDNLPEMEIENAVEFRLVENRISGQDILLRYKKV